VAGPDLSSIMTGLSGIFDPQPSTDQFDPSKAIVSGAPSFEELVRQILQFGTPEQKAQVLEQLGMQGQGAPGDVMSSSPHGLPPPGDLAQSFRDAVAPVGQPDYRNAGLVPGIAGTPTPTPTKNLIGGSDRHEPWDDIKMPGGQATAADLQTLLNQGGPQETPSPPPSGVTPPASSGDPKEDSTFSKFMQDLIDNMPTVDTQQRGPVDEEDITKQGARVLMGQAPYGPERPAQAGGSSTADEAPRTYAPPEPGDYSEEPPPYSSVGALDLDHPIRSVVKDVTTPPQDRGYAPRAPIGAVNITDPPQMKQIVYPKDELTPYDAGIGDPPPKPGSPAAPAQESASGGLSNLKNILMGFHPSTPAGQALLAFGFGNAMPGGNFGSAGLQALQTYTSATNRRAEEQLRRDQMAAAHKERLDERKFQLSMQGHRDIREDARLKYQGDLAAWEARTKAAEHAQDINVRVGESEADRRQRATLAHVEAMRRLKDAKARRKEEGRKTQLVTREKFAAQQVRTAGRLAEKTIPYVRQGKDGSFWAFRPTLDGQIEKQQLVPPGGGGVDALADTVGFIRAQAQAFAARGESDHASQLNSMATLAEKARSKPDALLRQYQSWVNKQLGVEMPDVGGGGGQPGQQGDDELDKNFTAAEFEDMNHMRMTGHPDQAIIERYKNMLIQVHGDMPPAKAKELATRAYQRSQEEAAQEGGEGDRVSDKSLSDLVVGK
jgi:hypothetical protein